MGKVIKTTVGQMGNTFRTEFKIIRLLDNRLVSSIVEFNAELDFDEDAGSKEHLAAVVSLKRWFDLVVNDCFVFCPKNEIPTATIEELDNNIMFCPDEPHDHILLLVLAAKVNAIGNGVMEALHCHLTSDMGDGFGNWFEGDPDTILPTLTEWVGEHAYFDKPWWHRSDGSMIDVWAGPEDDLSQKPDILMDLLEGITETSAIPENAEPAEIIKPNFKPTIIRND